MESGKRATLPSQTQQWIGQLLAQFEAAYPEGAEIKEIVKCIKESRTVEKRQLMESTA